MKTVAGLRVAGYTQYASPTRTVGSTGNSEDALRVPLLGIVSWESNSCTTTLKVDEQETSTVLPEQVVGTKYQSPVDVFSATSNLSKRLPYYDRSLIKHRTDAVLSNENLSYNRILIL